MFAVFRQVSMRHFAQHKMRTILTVAGVSLGIAAIVGMWLVESSASETFERNMNRIAGRAQLTISDGQVGVPEELAGQAGAVPGVAAAAPSVQGFVNVRHLNGERVYLFGIDMLADHKVRDYQFDSSQGKAELKDPLVFLAQPDSVALTSGFMGKYHLKVGDGIVVQGASGPRTLTVRGILDVRHGPAAVFGGRLALMDIYAAERIFGFEHRFTQIDIVAARDADLDTLRDSLVKVVNGRGLVERSANRRKPFETSLAGFRSAYTFAGALAVVIGIYLIFNTLMISVTQRRREIGILRAVGMRRGEVLRLIALEAGLLGMVGAAAGVVLGFLFAMAVMPIFNAMLLLANPAEYNSGVYNFALKIPLMIVKWAVLFGLLSAVVAALVPAREAVRVQPVEAMRRLDHSHDSRSYRRAALAGAGCIALGIAVCLVDRSLSKGSAALLIEQIGFLLGASLMAPAAVQALATRIGERLKFSAHPLIAMAGRNMASDVRRIAITSAALAVSIAGAISMATILSSVEADLGKQLDLGFSGIDLLVASPAGVFDPVEPSNLMPLPRSLADSIAKLPGVAKVEAERWVRIPYRGGRANIVVSHGALRGLEYLAGRSSVADVLEAPIGEQVARRGGLRVGDTLRLPTPAGEVALRVCGIGYDASFDGWIGLNPELYRRLWRDDSVNQIMVVVKPGASIERVGDEIRGLFGERYGLTLLAAKAFYREAKDALRAATAGAYPISAMAIAIALLGVINSLIATVLDRTRQLGILRATVATRRQIATIVVLEAATVGLAGGLLGVGIGSIEGYAYMRDVFPALFGHLPLYRYPIGAAVFAFAGSILLSAAAGYIPGRSAARLKIVEALAYE